MVEHLGESEPQRLIFSDCPNQCAALYLVRILPAARCAGFRQAKSPGRVGRCRIPQRKSLRRMSGAFSLCIQSSLSPSLFSSQRAAIVLGAVIERALRAAQRDGGWNSRIGSPMCAACGGFSIWGNTWESGTLP